MRIEGISWAGDRTHSFERQRRFVEQILGLSVAHEASDFVVFKLPNGDTFEIFGPRAPNPPEQFSRNEIVIGFRVDDIDRAREELSSAGIELLGPIQQDRPGGHAWQHFRAPDGKVYELCYDPPPT